MSCWHPYCAVGVPSLLMLLLLLVISTIFASLAVSGLPPAVDVCNVPIVSTAVVNFLVASSC